MIVGHAPKNYKRGKFIMGRFTVLQLLTLLGCCAFSLFGCIMFSMYSKSMAVEWRITFFAVLLMPAVFAYAATFPMGIYHNLLNLTMLWIRHLKKVRKYSWEGIYQVEPEEHKK